MSNLNGVTITKGKIGANALAPSTAASILLVQSFYPLEESALVHTIYNMKDAENLGITLENDLAANTNLHRHISEFYRLAGEGTKLYLSVHIPITGSTDPDDDNPYTLVKLLQEGMAVLAATDGDARQMAVATSAAPGTMLNGLPSDVVNAVTEAQLLADWAYANHFPLNILIEGRNYGGNASATLDLRAIPDLLAKNVSVVIGQDWSYAENQSEANTLADVGTALGTLSAAAINQNIGDNEAFNLTEATKSAWMIPGLSNHVKNSDQLQDLQILENKGFIFGLKYTGLAGVRWNNDHTCIPVVIDAEGNINEHTIAYARTMNEASRLLRTAFLPKVKTKQPVNPSTGKLPAGVVKNFDSIGDTVFGDMVNRTEISAGKTFTNPDSDLLVEKVLQVQWRIVPYGTVGEINGILNLKNKI